MCCAGHSSPGVANLRRFDENVVMSRFAPTAKIVIALLISAQSSAQGSGPMCVEPAVRGGAAAAFSNDGGAASPDEVVLFMRRDGGHPAFFLDALRSEMSGEPQGAPPKSPSVRYSLSDNVTAGVSYSHAVLFETASDEELRQSRASSFSTARERDVLGLGMDWGLSDKSRVGIGYQLQSVRPDGSTSPTQSTSILPGSQALDHTFTLGVSRSWGGSSPE